eukprot:TRINITY_DN1321_c0_g1_i1.p1 TRINITY_DN1321_c0_g1~~TRINITY_DN1321_c0_g1_i1.p1  ORF type:complete len:892 (-),score=149.08 TRINITY_DN1321_c0_g1_i1:106-2781(-)
MKSSLAQAAVIAALVFAFVAAVPLTETVLFKAADPAGDLWGPYAQSSTKGVWDLVRFTSSVTPQMADGAHQDLIFRVEFAQTKTQETGLYLQIYVDADSVMGSGATHAYKNPLVTMDSQRAWDFMIETNGRDARLILADCGEPSDFFAKVSYDASINTLVITISSRIITEIGYTISENWSYGVLVGDESNFTFRPSVVDGSAIVPQVADILTSDESSQEAILSSGSFPTVPLVGSSPLKMTHQIHNPLNLARFESLTCGADSLGPKPWASNQCGYVLSDGTWAYRGSSFRVWAPFAEAVGWASNINAWVASPMVAQAGGYWCLNVTGALPGTQYYYEIQYKGQTLKRMDPRSQSMKSPPDWVHSEVHEPEFDWGQVETPVIRNKLELVIYEIHIGTFNPQTKTKEGTFGEAIARLDYLKELGVNAVELMPVNDFPNEISWGYNPGNFFAIDNVYGGYQEFKRLIKECLSRGIYVFVDVVFNHVGGPNVHWVYDGWTEIGNGFPGGEPGGIYFYQDYRANTPWGPRPDYGRSEVRQFFVDNIETLMREYKVSGFRWDATICIRRPATYCWESRDTIPEGWNMMAQANDLTASLGGVSIAEDLQYDITLNLPSSQGGAAFSGQWEEQFYHTMKGILTTADDNSRDMDALYRKFTESSWHQYRVIYTETHDKASGQNSAEGRMPLLIDRADPGSYWAQKRSMLGLAMVMTAPGMPMIFMGQEFLASENFSFDNTPDLNWTKVGDFHYDSTGRGVWSTVGPYQGLFYLTRDLIRLRRNLDGWSAGLSGPNLNFFHINNADKVVAFHRWNRGGAGDDVIVIANFRNRAYTGGYTIGLPRAGYYRVRVNSDLKKYSPDFTDFGAQYTTVQAIPGSRDGLNYYGTVYLGPYSFVVLSQ